MERIKVIQDYLKTQCLDAWILVDYENRNKTLVSFVGEKMLTRKILMVFPRTGKPYLITHLIDTVFLKDPEVLHQFDLHVYKTWKEMLAYEKNDFKNYKKVAMDISEEGLLPRIALADYGSVDFIKSLASRSSPAVTSWNASRLPMMRKPMKARSGPARKLWRSRTKPLR
jgi:hypothetical protein